MQEKPLRVSLILMDEYGKAELDLLNVEQTINIGEDQYAVVQKGQHQQTFSKVVKEFDGTMRLADILDDAEFEMVQDVFLAASGGH